MPASGEPRRLHLRKQLWYKASRLYLWGAHPQQRLSMSSMISQTYRTGTVGTWTAVESDAVVLTNAMVANMMTRGFEGGLPCHL